MKTAIFLCLLVINFSSLASAGTWTCSDPQNSGMRMQISIDVKAFEGVPVGKVVENVARIVGTESSTSTSRELILPVLQMNVRCPNCFAYLVDPNRGQYGLLYFSFVEQKEVRAQVTARDGLFNFSYNQKLSCIRASSGGWQCLLRVRDRKLPVFDFKPNRRFFIERDCSTSCSEDKWTCLNDPT